MPELPDVEGFRLVLAEHATGRRVECTDVADSGVLRGVTADDFDEALRGHRFAEPARHGKWLIARTDGPAVLMHFGMTGSLCWTARGEPRHRHDRVVFVCGGGELRFRDMRKLQGISLVRQPGIHPRRPAREVTAAERIRLHAQMRRTLHATVRAGHVPAGPSWLTGRRDRDGAVCPRCGTSLCRAKIAGRSTVWCPHCQRR